MPFLLKAYSMALLEHPLVNSQLILPNRADSADYHLVLRKSHNIGVAMDTSAGLFVPNIKNVQDLSVLSIAAELHRLQQLGKKGSFSQQDLTGGTSTLSNIGVLGGTVLRPVLFSGELCIAAIGKLHVVPRWELNAWTPRNVISVSLSADHRVIDGATIARFTKTWRELVEQPSLMISTLR